MEERVKTGLIIAVFTLLILLFSLSCNSITGNGEWDLPVTRDTITITAETDTALLSDYYSKVEYLQLESNDASLFSTADKVITTDSLIYVYDAMSETVILFSDKGEFINRYWDRFDRRINDFDVTSEGEVLALLNNRIVVKLDWQLNPISDTRLSFLATSLIHVNDDKVLFFTDFFPGQQSEEAAGYHLMLYDIEKGRGNGVLPVSYQSDEGRIRIGKSLYRSDYRLFVIPYSDVLVFFTREGIASALKVDYSALINREGKDKPEMAWITNVYRKENILRFEFAVINDGFVVKKDILYDISNGRLVGELINDYNGFLGLTSVNGTFSKGFTGVLYPSLLEKYSKETGETMPEELRNIPIGSNPVIVFYYTGL